MSPEQQGLIAYLAVLVTQRIFELAISARHARALQARGGVLAHDPAYVGIVTLHTLYPLVLTFDVLLLGARAPSWWPAALAVLVAAQALRYAAIRALGERWNVRVWVVPGEPPVSGGIYRVLRHPNYVAVVIEFIAAPLMFGAWRTALVASAVNALLLAIRIKDEEKALAATSA